MKSRSSAAASASCLTQPGMSHIAQSQPMGQSLKQVVVRIQNSQSKNQAVKNVCSIDADTFHSPGGKDATFVPLNAYVMMHAPIMMHKHVMMHAHMTMRKLVTMYAHVTMHAHVMMHAHVTLPAHVMMHAQNVDHCSMQDFLRD